MLILELLDDHRVALKAKKGEAADLRREMERLSTAGKMATEEISQLKVGLCHEVTTCSCREGKLARVREELKKGSEILEDSEL